ncbi:ribonuclease domain-containing protein, partial [Helicobacter trogontum]|uniref:ribonuclease domain-containing protein n=1 Tax=Helicobacter trogontum TaxID=50960 RepID=UPI001EE8C8FD
LEGVLAALGMTSIPAFVIVGAISALTAGILMNTQAGKDFVNFLTDDIAKPLIDSIESKLKSFFSLFDSNPSKYELVSNPTLESNDYQSLIELLLDPNSNALDIDTLLHTFPNYLAYPTHSYSTKDSTNSSLALSTPKDALPIHIKAQCFNHKKEALSNREIYVYSPNFYSFVDRAKSDENGFIEFHNAYVSSKMTNSDLYFVLNRYGLDEEQKDFHIKISPSKTIQPKDKQVGELLEQRLSFEKNIPKAITLNDNIKPNIKVISIECKDIKYTHNNANTQVKAKSNTPHNITMNNTSIKSHHTNNTIESITLQAHYVLKDSHKKNIQGDEQSLLKESIQRYKHKTKWGYIVFDRDEEIEQTLKQVNKTQPLIYSKRFKELENIKGEIVNIPFKEEWENKQIRFFAYLWRANRDVGIDVEKREYSYIIQVVHTKQEEKAWYENEKLWNTIDAVSLGAAFIPVGGWTAGVGIKAGAEGAKVAIRWASKKLTTRTLKLRNTQNKITIQQYEYKITKYITRSTNRVAKPKYPKQSLSQMPQHVRARYEERVASNWKRSKGVPDKKLEAGRKWKNDIAQLPTRDTKGNPIFYKEHDISIASSQSGRGAERIVVGHSQDGNVLYDYIYYTPNHYNDFIHLIPK